MKIWSQSLGEEVEPEKVPLEDLICVLYSIYIVCGVSGDFLSEHEVEEKYAVIDEVVRRLKESSK